MYFLILGLVPLTMVLARLLQDAAPLPEWLVSLTPLLIIAITWALNNVPPIAAFGKRNVTAVVAFVLGVPITLAALHLAPIPAFAGDVLAWLNDVTLWVGTIWGVWLAQLKTAQAIYDLVNGQLATPSGAAKELILKPAASLDTVDGANP